MELTKRDTKMIQGLSVLAMLCLHLFDRDYTGLFTPLVFVRGEPLSFFFGQLSDFCVFGYALIVLIPLFARTLIMPNLIVASVSGFILMVLFHFWKNPLFVQKIFEFMGTYSTNIWLTHMFFFSVLFVNFVYIAKYPF